MTKAEMTARAESAEKAVAGLREVNDRQLARLVGEELLKIRVAELERALDDAVAARCSVEQERDKLRAQVDDILARLVRGEVRVGAARSPMEALP